MSWHLSHVEALEAAGLVHVALVHNTTMFGTAHPATDMTPDEARVLARELVRAADQVESV